MRGWRRSALTWPSSAGTSPPRPGFEVSAGFKFSDLAVDQRSGAAQANVDQAAQRAGALRDQLKGQIGTLTERLTPMDSERRQPLPQ
jgi:hypothetical protein